MAVEKQTNGASGAFGSLKVKTVGSGKERVKVVLLPGHEYGIEHFLPENLETIERKGNADRTRLVRSKLEQRKWIFWRKQPRFILKGNRTRDFYPKPRLTPDSELRLARFVSKLGVRGVKVEQPLAVLMRPSGAHEVVYREISPFHDLVGKTLDSSRGASFRVILTRILSHFTPAQHRVIERLDFRLTKEGIIPADFLGNIEPGKFGTVHLFDLEYWQVPDELSKRLRLKYVVDRPDRKMPW